MPLFKTPEVANLYGALDSTAFTDGVAGHAHLLREMARNGNRLVQRYEVAVRYLSYADPAPELAQLGVAIQWAPPRWSSLINVPFMPVRKMPGLTHLMCRVRYRADVNARLQFAVTTSAQSDILSVPDANTASVVATGGEDTADFTTVIGAGHFDTITWWVRSFPDVNVDALMNEGTYGAHNGGANAQVFGNELVDSTSTWNDSGDNMPHKGGHYVFIDMGGGAVHPPAEIVATLDPTRILFYPPTATRYYTACSYNIYKLPAFATYSVAAYCIP